MANNAAGSSNQGNQHQIAQNPITRLTLYIAGNHNSVTISRQETSRETSGRSVAAMLDAMNPDDLEALAAFCLNVSSYLAGPKVTTSVAGLRRI